MANLDCVCVSYLVINPSLCSCVKQRFAGIGVRLEVLCVLLLSRHFSNEVKWIKKGIFVLDKGETK